MREWLDNPDDGESICVGFDGSDSDDWTAIRCETMDGYSFTPRYGPDRRPTIWNPAEWEGSTPRGEVTSAVDEIFSRWRVKRMYCDPPDWRTEIGEWSLEHGDEHVMEWPTYRIKQMHAALSRFTVDLASGRISHDGCPMTDLAVANARRIAKPGQKYILGKPVQTQKIDPAMATVLAHEAAMDAHAAGWAQTMNNTVIVLG